MSLLPVHKRKPKHAKAAPPAKPASDNPPAADNEYQLDGFTVRVIRSARRRRTVSANLVSWRMVEVRAPDIITEQDLADIVRHLIDGIKVKQSRQRLVTNDETLQKRSDELNRRYFGNQLKWRSIRYVSNQTQRYGSCTPHQGTIRISDRLKQVPGWVLDYVLIHELAHLVERGHTPAFWQVVNRYERAERARGYLMAMALLEDEVSADSAQED